MQPIIDHLQVTVKDLDQAEPFYDNFLSLLGFDVTRKNRTQVEKYAFEVLEYPHPRLAFAINSPRQAFVNDSVHRRKPGAMHHLAFQAESRTDVDQFYQGLQAMGAEIAGGPKLWPEHGADYYAVFFKDPDGLKYEVVHSPHPS